MTTAQENPTITDDQGNLYEIVYLPQLAGGHYVLKLKMPARSKPMDVNI